MNKFFNMNSPFFQFMEKVANLIILNVLFMLGCIPIVTIGTSITATYYVALKMVRGEDPYIIKNYWKAFKKNFRQSVILHIIMLVIAYVLYLDYELVYNPDTPYGKGTFIVLIVLSVIYIFVNLYAYPFLAQFYNSIPKIIQNSLFMSIRHLGQTIAMLLVYSLPVWMIVLLGFDNFLVCLFALFLLGFSSMIYLNASLLVKVFDKYIPEQDEEYVAPEERVFEDESHRVQEQNDIVEE
ncbi:MAG: YesL family protein [Eubacteriales bacterium]|nr:YesL family protein [Eubacteriales bacterium]